MGDLDMFGKPSADPTGADQARPVAPRSFAVQVSSHLLAELLDQWSEPVQVRITWTAPESGQYQMEFRRAEATEPKESAR